MHGIKKWIDWLIHCDIIPYVAERTHYDAPRPKLTSTYTMTCTSKREGSKPFTVIKSIDGVIRMIMDLPL